jgi:hypothetical protein
MEKREREREKMKRKQKKEIKGREKLLEAVHYK